MKNTITKGRKELKKLFLSIHNLGGGIEDKKFPNTGNKGPYFWNQEVPPPLFPIQTSKKKRIPVRKYTRVKENFTQKKTV